MAYSVDRNDDGTYSLRKDNSNAWEGLAANVTGLDAKAIMAETGLDWTVSKVPTYVNLEGIKGKGATVIDGKSFLNNRIPTGQSALVRESDGEIMDMISGAWNPVQNEDAFNLFCDIANKGGMSLERAGQFRDGRMVWAQARINAEVEVIKGDVIVSHLLLHNPHLYGKSFGMGYTETRVICENTLAQALKGSTVAKFGHRKAFDVHQVTTVVMQIRDHLMQYKEAGQFLASKRINEEKLDAFINKLFPITGKNEREETMSRPGRIVKSVMDTQPGAHFGEGSFWQAFNAVTFFVDHLQGHNNDNRLNNAWFGTGATKKNEAFSLALEMANAA